MPSHRILIIGNCGTGKSTLGQRLAGLTGVPVHSLDALFWLPDVWGQKREEQEAREAACAVAAKPEWIVEGVFGALAEEMLPRATRLIWLDYPWSVIEPLLHKRGPKPGESEAAYFDLLTWAKAYWQRDSSNSFAGHLRLFEMYQGEKHRLTSLQESELLDPLTKT